jgi:hypothetical protein
MATWIGWVLMGVIAFFWFSTQQFSQRKRRHLNDYVIFLLLKDDIRNDHKAKFEQWIRQSGAKDAMQLGMRAHTVIESMADSLATEVPLGAHSALWNCDAAGELRSTYASVTRGVVKA